MPFLSTSNPVFRYVSYRIFILTRQILKQFENRHFHHFKMSIEQSSAPQRPPTLTPIPWSLFPVSMQWITCRPRVLIPPPLCVCFIKQNVEVSRMSEEALLTVPAHQWGSPPLPQPHPPLPFFTHTVPFRCTMYLTTLATCYLLHLSPLFFSCSSSTRVLRCDDGGNWLESSWFLIINPMTQILCPARSPIFGEWMKSQWRFLLKLCCTPNVKTPAACWWRCFYVYFVSWFISAEVV